MYINDICNIFLIIFHQHTDASYIIPVSLQIVVPRAEIFIEPFKMMIVLRLVTFSGRQERRILAVEEKGSVWMVNSFHKASMPVATSAEMEIGCG